MISISNLSLYFGGQDVFDNIFLTVNKGDKIGLVGKKILSKTSCPPKYNERLLIEIIMQKYII
jgi:ABC-type branched-subunit amino acid transport system ATPase component